VVAERYVEAGAYVRPDTRVISLVAVDALRVEFSVPEQHLGAVKEGGALTFTVPAYPDRTFSATVRYVGAAVRESTRDLVAEALADNADRALRPGMFATVALITGEGPLPVVPKTCLLDKDGRAHLFVVVEQHLEERVVQTGVAQGDVIAVIRGIKAGDKVVARPTDLLRNGQPVN
jgi:membrane fusion protein (multidrug efflux system)